jgi:hypothetical protein
MAQGECRIHNFLDTFKKHKAQLLRVSAYKDASAYERAVYATWDMSYAAIQGTANVVTRPNSEAEVARNAINLLYMLAFFHYENVMEDGFRRAAENKRRGARYWSQVTPDIEFVIGAGLPENLLPLGHDRKWDAQHYRQAVRLLRSYSLPSVNQISGSLSMHRLVHGWAFDRQSPDIRQVYMRLSAATVANSVCWKHSENDHSFQRSLLPHITRLDHRADGDGLDLLTGIFEKADIRLLYYDAGKTKAAEKLLYAMLESSNKLLGPEHSYTLSYMACVALAVWQQGRAAEAEELHLQTFELLKKVLGSEHPITLISIGNIASAVWQQGRAAEAEELHRQEFELKK